MSAPVAAYAPPGNAASTGPVSPMARTAVTVRARVLRDMRGAFLSRGCLRSGETEEPCGFGECAVVGLPQRVGVQPGTAEARVRQRGEPVPQLDGGAVRYRDRRPVRRYRLTGVDRRHRDRVPGARGRIPLFER